jgi:hypothetical protein
MEVSSSQLAQQMADLKSLELLFDYTKFHIGLYLTLASAYITVASVKIGDRLALSLDWPFVIAAMVAFMLAGFAGGVIVSSITQCYGVTADCKSTAAFLERPIGPWDLRILWFEARLWTYLEHTSFWAGLALAFLSFIRGHKRSSKAARALSPSDPASAC